MTVINVLNAHFQQSTVDLLKSINFDPHPVVQCDSYTKCASGQAAATGITAADFWCVCVCVCVAVQPVLQRPLFRNMAVVTE